MLGTEAAVGKNHLSSYQRWHKNINHLQKISAHYRLLSSSQSITSDVIGVDE
jgi:hypothetical protein